MVTVDIDTANYKLGICTCTLDLWCLCSQQDIVLQFPHKTFIIRSTGHVIKVLFLQLHVIEQLKFSQFCEC